MIETAPRAWRWMRLGDESRNGQLENIHAKCGQSHGSRTSTFRECSLLFLRLSENTNNSNTKEWIEESKFGVIFDSYIVSS